MLNPRRVLSVAVLTFALSAGGSLPAFAADSVSKPAPIGTAVHAKAKPSHAKHHKHSFKGKGKAKGRGHAKHTTGRHLGRR